MTFINPTRVKLEYPVETLQSQIDERVTTLGVPKTGGTMTGNLVIQAARLLQRLGAIADVADSTIDGPDLTHAEVTGTASTTRLLGRVVRRVAASGHDGVVHELLRVTDATTQTIVQWWPDRIQLVGGGLRVPDGRILQRGKGGAVLNLLGVSSSGNAGTVDAATTGLQSMQAGTVVVTTDAAGAFAVAYPTAFATGVVSVVATPGDVAGSVGQLVLNAYSLTGFSGIARTAAGALIASATIRINFVAVGS